MFGGEGIRTEFFHVTEQSFFVIHGNEMEWGAKISTFMETSS